MDNVTNAKSINCIRGCRIRDHHTSTCEGECRGCLPRPAEHGHLCQSCYNRAENALTELSVRVPWIETIGRELGRHASATAPDQTGVHGGDPAEGSVLHAAYLQADAIRSDLTGWVHVVIDDRGLQRGPIPGQEPAYWLLPHLPWIAGHEAVADFVDEMSRDLSQAMAWPTPLDVEPAKHLDIPCPRCDNIALVYTPPRWEGLPFRVECTDPDCARVFSEDEWDRFKGLLVTAGVAA